MKNKQRASARRGSILVAIGAIVGTAVIAITFLAGPLAKASAPTGPEWRESDMAAFAQYLADKHAGEPARPIAKGKTYPRPPVDPFAQLTRIGFDGEGLRRAAASMQIDTERFRGLDLAAIDVESISADDRRCLTQAIYYEARNQSIAGQMAVADVVLNRVASRHYPNSICKVVFQGSNRRTGCQFSFTCDGSMNRPIERRAMRDAQTVATAILGGFHLPLTAEALNYHATYVDPYWAPTLYKTAKIDDHIFYTPKKRRRAMRLAMAN
jgi:hypothetical protein